MTFIYCIKLDIWYNIFEKKRNFLKNRRRMLVAKNLKLKLARVELDMTQGDLAESVGVTRQTIGLIEAGKYNPRSLALSVHMQMLRQNVRPTILGGRR